LNTGPTPGAIVFNYLDVDTGDDASDGRSATVGIKDTGTQSGAGARRLLLSRNTAGTVASGRALRIATVDGSVTGDIVDVAPDPRDTPVNSININFSEKVGNFTLADLVLQRDGGGPNLLSGSGTTLASGDGGLTWTLGNLSTLTAPVGAYRLSLAAAGSGITGLGGNPFTSDVVEAWNRVAGAPPTVTGVYVASTAWNSAYLTHLQNTGQGSSVHGYAIDPSDQTNELAWSNLNKVSVRFSRDVNVTAGMLAVAGVNVASYGVAAFSYDPTTFTATWTLSSAIPNDKVTLNLDADPGTGVSGAGDGVPLDGEWFNSSPPMPPFDTFPSGNGTAGGDFNFIFRVLPGDIDRNGIVSTSDFNVWKSNFGQMGKGVLFGDLDGNNLVSTSDFNAWKSFFGKTSPA
jgi:hypothetical protein